MSPSLIPVPSQPFKRSTNFKLHVLGSEGTSSHSKSPNRLSSHFHNGNIIRWEKDTKVVGKAGDTIGIVTINADQAYCKVVRKVGDN